MIDKAGCVYMWASGYFLPYCYLCYYLKTCLECHSSDLYCCGSYGG